jgi:hypothetical protein
MKLKLRLILAFLFIAVFLPLLVWGFWPPRRETRVVPLVPSSLGMTLSEPRDIRLEFSPSIRAGESEIVRLWLEPGKDYVADRLYENYTVIAEARLELPLADVRPANIISTPLVAGGSASFYWEVKPRQPGTVRGTAWLYLRFLPKGGGEETRVAVSAQEVAIRSGSVLKRTGAEARVVGAIGSLVGLLLAFPFVRKLRR